ncbi:hypothetical protein [Methylomicrobium album]|uniref:hypothetical protein n=1 Tax=Methylomicrobium album TaxID=39775 RepID=UPI0002623ED9|nr:hypothetical protein [Methylomicrobium album]
MTAQQIGEVAANLQQQGKIAVQAFDKDGPKQGPSYREEGNFLMPNRSRKVGNYGKQWPGDDPHAGKKPVRTAGFPARFYRDLLMMK